ncbi:S-layer homology domain-containing protein [uncultured Flavonifractor sp.]|uniref:S-layer homology domain-containing protein n=1 Tax=uncultured Flavonifractor sp. TaxID=1193534 RepID=UPI00260D096F|nr:S-layer homology domain-containing protein [uncultured Flavonifractor sp.]
MSMKRRIQSLILAGALALSLALPAAASGYSDLPESHWAYSDLMEASQLGIIQGVGNGQMAPSATMSWGQFLTMLTRTFAAEAYQSATGDGLAWDQAGYAAAVESGLLREEDTLPVSPESLGGDISRQDAAVLLYNALPEDAWEHYYVWGETQDPSALSDWNDMDPLHQQAVSGLAELGIINGKSDGSFGCTDSIQRCDGTVLVMRVLEVVDSCLRYEEKDITVRILDAQSGQAILPDQQMSSRVGEYLSSLPYQLEQDALKYYNYNWSASQVSQVSSACSTYTLYYTPMTQAQREETDFWERVDQGLASYEDYWKQDFWLKFQGENERKYELLFGDATKRRFSSQEEASAAMTTITIPVWKLSNGTKVSSTLSLSIHSAIAEDVKAIFTEIYNDPEQFPIHDIGGYSWRGDSATGEHNCGTAIDINANENYQVRDGQALVGSLWQPGSNPYSIAPDSSVVRIFAEHGWSWGGDAWAGSSDASQGYHDYMHFSYMGM